MKYGNGNPWPEEDVARITGMYRAGISTKEIARRFDTTPNAISLLMGRKGAYRTLTRKGGPMFHAKTKYALDTRDHASPFLGNAEREAEK